MDFEKFLLANQRLADQGLARRSLPAQDHAPHGFAQGAQMVFGFEGSGAARQPQSRQVGPQRRQRFLVQEAGQVQRTVGIDFRDRGTDEQLRKFVAHGGSGDLARRLRQGQPGAVERLVGVKRNKGVGAGQAGEQRVVGRGEQQPRDQPVDVGARLLFLRQWQGNGNKAGGPACRLQISLRTVRSHGRYLFFWNAI